MPSSTGWAKKRSATSRCTITHQLAICSTWRLSATSRCGDVVGQVRDELCGRWIEARDVEPHRVAPVDVVRSMPTRCGARRRSSSTACTWATRSARNRVRTPSPGPTSSTTSSGSRSASRAITPQDVLVDQEVLAERLLRRDASQSEDRLGVGDDLRRGSPRRAAPPGSRTCGRRRRARCACRARAAGRGTGCRSRRAGGLRAPAVLPSAGRRRSCR